MLSVLEPHLRRISSAARVRSLMISMLMSTASDFEILRAFELIFAESKEQESEKPKFKILIVYYPEIESYTVPDAPEDGWIV